MKRKMHLKAILVISVIAAAGSYAVIQSGAKPPTTTYAYKVATYNILGSGANAAPDFNARKNVNTAKRADAAVKVIKDSSYDIVGLQELDFYKEPAFKDNQFYMFKNRLEGSYKLFPADSRISTNKNLHFEKASMRAIAYKSDRFRIKDSGFLNYPYQNAPNLEARDSAPWVLLEDSRNSALKFYVLNIHMIAYNNSNCRWDCNPPPEPGSSDVYGIQKRKRAAEIVRDWAANKKASYPVIVLGDFNSAYTLKHTEIASRESALPYCVLTSKTGKVATLRDTRDAYEGRGRVCANNSTESVIDHIFATQRFAVTNWSRLKNSNTDIASDHKPTQATLTISVDTSAGFKQTAGPETEDFRQQTPPTKLPISTWQDDPTDIPQE